MEQRTTSDHPHRHDVNNSVSLTSQDSPPVPVPCVSTCLWPALSEPRAAQALALQFQLDQSQWWQPDVLQKWQFTQLQALIKHARQHTPFYQAHWQHIDVPEDVSPAAFKSFPVVTRDHIQTNPQGLRSVVMPQYHGQLRQISTSGSTGKPVDILKDEITAFMAQAFTLRDHRWHRRDLTARLATIRHSPGAQYQAPHGKQQRGWSASLQGIYQSGESFRLDSACTTDQQWSWLKKANPAYLMTYPSNLAALLEYSQSKQERLTSLRQVTTLSEILPEALRERVALQWQCELVDIYSCQEAGNLALQCPQHEHYHVQSENVLLEVLDDNGRQCEAGETGRVVVTSLNNFASPLIRYEVGDYAEVGESCPCGRGLPVLNRIFGRTRNMLTYPDGRTAWPYLGGAGNYKHIAPIRQFQVVQTDLNTLEFHLVVEQPLDRAQQTKLTERLHDALKYPFTIEYIYHDHIPRGAGGKFEDFKSLITKQSR